LWRYLAFQYAFFMLIRHLVPSDAAAYQSLRLAALRESPSAFGSSYEEECDSPLATVEAYLDPNADRCKFGAFDGDDLVGIIGVAREGGRKVRHKGFIRGMYVAPSHRAKGIGKQLLERGLAFAMAMEGLRQVTLSVTAGNASAIAMYETMGFKAFGHEPEALYVDGVFYGNVHMVLSV
jgi:ribosomal protein S18 acetylase RimI-like enzyme